MTTYEDDGNFTLSCDECGTSRPVGSVEGPPWAMVFEEEDPETGQLEYAGFRIECDCGNSQEVRT